MKEVETKDDKDDTLKEVTEEFLENKLEEIDKVKELVIPSKKWPEVEEENLWYCKYCDKYYPYFYFLGKDYKNYQTTLKIYLKGGKTYTKCRNCKYKLITRCKINDMLNVNK